MISVEHDGSPNKKDKLSTIAKQRWRLLAQVLHKKSNKDSNESSVSIRRFSSFGLFKVSTISEDSKCIWQEYQTNIHQGAVCKIRLLSNEFKTDTLQGFDNTGNVCIWPAEEVMSYYCLKNSDIFQKKDVIELGGGMACLAGVSVAVLGEANHVHITDGNEESVQNLKLIVERNQHAFGSTRVTSSLFRWGPHEVDESFQESYDFVLCSDCLFMKEGREDLINTMYLLLRNKGKAIVFAPKRGTSFKDFTKVAGKKFSINVIFNYDDNITNLHTEFKTKDLDLYDQDIHYPILLEMTKD